MLAWIQDVKDSCDKEKKHMEERIGALLKEKEATLYELKTMYPQLVLLCYLMCQLKVSLSKQLLIRVPNLQLYHILPSMQLGVT